MSVIDQMSSKSPKSQTLTEIYGKDSFDRFGDDLAKVVLTHLQLEERFAFRGMSNQCNFCLEDILEQVKWVYLGNWFKAKTQTPIEKLRLIAKYCPNVSSIEYCKGIRKELFNLVLDKWPKVNEVRFVNLLGIQTRDLDRFIKLYGPNLKRFHYRGSLIEDTNQKAFTKILKSSPNLECVTDSCLWNDMYWFMLFMGLTVDNLFDKEQLLVTKLKKLLFEHQEGLEDKLTQVIEANKNSLEVVKVFNTSEIIDSTFSLFQDLSKLSNLRDLSIKTHLGQLTERFFFQKFNELSQSCPSITKIYLNLTYVFSYGTYTPKSLRYSFKSFTNLKYLGLYLSLPFDNYIFITSKPPKAPKGLIAFDLKVYSTHSRLNSQFIEGVVKKFPNLQRLTCLQFDDLNSDVLKLLSKLPKLQSLEIESIHCTATNGQITEGLKAMKKLLQLNIRWSYGKLRPVLQYFPGQLRLPIADYIDL